MGYGRPNIPGRLMRHFNCLIFSETDEKTLFYITNRLLEWGFKGYVDKINSLSNSLGQIAINIYN